jgi:capsular exopolysaccharide synthesis family protein
VQLKEEFQLQNKKVRELELAASQLKTNLGISEIDAAMGARGTTLEPENLRKLESQYLEAKSDFKRIDAFYGYLTNLSRADFKKAILTASPDTQLGMLVDQQNAGEQQLARIVENLGPEHPDVRSVKRVLEQIERQVGDRLEGILTGLRAKRESELARLNNLQEDLNRYRDFDIETQVKRQPFWATKRQIENEQLILDKLNLRVVQETIESKLPKTGIVEVMDRAEPSFKAARPKKFLNITLGVIVGLAIGVGLAFFIEYLDTSVKTIDDVERALQAPVLGVIPQNVGSLIDEGPDSPHAEAYRVLRTNILFSQKDPKLNSITIVSGGAGEGKSTTTFNLATIFAQNNQRVLIVDSDLRRPSLHKLFKVSNSIGLTNYLLKQNTLEEVIQTSQLATLDFLPSGKLPSSSMGVLSSAQMKELIRDLKRRYDYVFFDSPPIMGVSDASILASEVDIVLQVIQYRRYPQPMTIRAKQMIEKVGGNLLGRRVEQHQHGERRELLLLQRLLLRLLLEERRIEGREGQGEGRRQVVSGEARLRGGGCRDRSQVLSRFGTVAVQPPISK